MSDTAVSPNPLTRLVDAVLLAEAMAPGALPGLDRFDAALISVWGVDGWSKELSRNTAAIALFCSSAEEAAKQASAAAAAAFGRELIVASATVFALAAQLAQRDGVTVAEVLLPLVAEPEVGDVR